jgi:hypothetical protein
MRNAKVQRGFYGNGGLKSYTFHGCIVFEIIEDLTGGLYSELHEVRVDGKNSDPYLFACQNIKRREYSFS